MEEALIIHSHLNAQTAPLLNKQESRFSLNDSLFFIFPQLLPVSYPLLFGLFRHSAFILCQRPLFLGRVLDPGAIGSYYIIVRGDLVLEKVTFGIEIIPGGNAIPAKLIPAVCRVRIIRVAVPPAALSPDPALAARIAVGCLIGCDCNTLPLSVFRFNL